MPSSRIPSAVQLLRKGASLHSNEGLRDGLERLLGAGRTFDELELPFQCVAADVEDALERWFDDGDLVTAILASAALPAVYPPVTIDGRRYVDGGVIDNVPISRAVELGCRTIYVLQLGPHGRPDVEIRRPLDGALLAYWIARNTRFARDLATLPPKVEAVVLPPGRRPDLKYDDFGQTDELVAQGYENTTKFLDERELEAEGRRRGSELLAPIERLVVSARSRSMRQAERVASSPDGAIVTGADGVADGSPGGTGDGDQELPGAPGEAEADSPDQ
jgi:NTE family protein